MPLRTRLPQSRLTAIIRNLAVLLYRRSILRVKPTPHPPASSPDDFSLVVLRCALSTSSGEGERPRPSSEITPLISGEGLG